MQCDCRSFLFFFFVVFVVLVVVVVVAEEKVVGESSIKASSLFFRIKFLVHESIEDLFIAM